jgi:hypothetical protein
MAAGAEGYFIKKVAEYRPGALVCGCDSGIFS